MQKNKTLGHPKIDKIYGVKTYLKKLNKTNLKKSIKWLKDPEINKYLSENIKNLTYNDELEWFYSISHSNNDIVFSINTIFENKYIGNCGIHKINYQDKTCEFGIFIGEKSYQNKGYGTDAIYTILKFVKEILNLKKIYLIVYEYNNRALKVYKKCGFNVISVLKNYHFYNLRYWDAYLMEYIIDDLK